MKTADLWDRICEPLMNAVDVVYDAREYLNPLHRWHPWPLWLRRLFVLTLPVSGLLWVLVAVLWLCALVMTFVVAIIVVLPIAGIVDMWTAK